MSSSTLQRRLDERRSVSTVPFRLPNPFLINGVARPGSARFVVSQKSRRPLMRTSSSDILEEVRPNCRIFSKHLSIDIFVGLYKYFIGLSFSFKCFSISG